MKKTSPKLFKTKKPAGSSVGHGAGYALRGRVWLEKDGELYLGWGRVMLLEGIDELGSIAAAARSMKLAYRNAWLWIEAMNRLAPAPLVEKGVGGTGGGHARLTSEGRKAIAAYTELRLELRRFLDRQHSPSPGRDTRRVG
ncbi:MAG: LysR family transcriptional regulator [Chloroflexi bacterium]|nr:LysR family transcriptional regulator [Chloroflexota bacterium]